MPRSALDRTPQQAGPRDLRARPGRAAEVRGPVIPRTGLELSELKHSASSARGQQCQKTWVILELIAWQTIRLDLSIRWPLLAANFVLPETIAIIFGDLRGAFSGRRLLLPAGARSSVCKLLAQFITSGRSTCNRIWRYAIWYSQRAASISRNSLLLQLVIVDCDDLLLRRVAIADCGLSKDSYNKINALCWYDLYVTWSSRSLLGLLEESSTMSPTRARSHYGRCSGRIFDATSWREGQT